MKLPIGQILIVKVLKILLDMCKWIRDPTLCELDTLMDLEFNLNISNSSIDLD